MERIALLNTLLVENLEDYRRFLCTTLEEKTPCVVIGEASDGMEAVKKAEELQPDLVLLDLGLPKPNGMEVARRIRRLTPNSKTLMVGQDSCVEVVLGAMRLECEDICASLMWTSFPMAFKHWSMEPSLSAAASDTSSPQRDQPRATTVIYRGTDD